MLYCAATSKSANLRTCEDWHRALLLPDHYTVEAFSPSHFEDGRPRHDLIVSSDSIPADAALEGIEVKPLYYVGWRRWLDYGVMLWCIEIRRRGADGQWEVIATEVC